MYKTIVVAGPPYSGADIVAERLAAEHGFQVVTDADVGRSFALNMQLSDQMPPAVIATTALAHIVHEFTGNLVIYVLRDVDDILHEMETAEYDQDMHIGTIIRDLNVRDTKVREAFDRIDVKQSLPKILYDWWFQFQKSEIDYWFGKWEEIQYGDNYTLAPTT